MTLHIFNPEHDMCLAANDELYVAKKAGKLLRKDLSFFPALWANDGDVVLVDDIERAETLYSNVIMSSALLRKKVRFVTNCELASLPLASVSPWGWDLCIRRELVRAGVDEKLLPSKESISLIRQLSSREFIIDVQKELLSGFNSEYQGMNLGQMILCESCACYDVEEVERRFYVSRRGIVVKSPWSCSGRGVMFVEKEDDENEAVLSFIKNRGWIGKTICEQGCVTVEPLYDKVLDFAMEFCADGHGNVYYLGLSVFNATNGFYHGNMIDAEKVKEKIITDYIPDEVLCCIKERLQSLCSSCIASSYQGVFGIDMMIVKVDDGYAINPLVEINMRHTMGYVATVLSNCCYGMSMCIELCEGVYNLNISAD